MIPLNIDSSLEIYLLGKFQVRIKGVLINKTDWKRRSAIKLLKLLALAPEHRIHREQLMEYLWADQYSENLTNNLNKTIHDARRALEPGLRKPADSQFVISENQQIYLNSPDNIWVDVAEFEKAAKAGIRGEELGKCESALGLYRGDLLPGDIYEDWTASRREHLRLLHRKLVTKTAEIYAREKRFERSIELLKNLNLSDPTDERVHQELMLLYALTGSKYQAYKQFEACRKMLAEIGFEPDQRTLAIKEEIQSGKIQPDREFFKRKKNETDEDHRAPAVNEIPSAPRVKKLTFDHGVVQSARFMNGGQSILFSAAWEETDFEIYKLDRQTLETEATGIARSGIFSVSPTDEIAVSLNRRFVRGYKSSGTLAIVNSAGGEPQEMLETIEWADWHPQKSASSRFTENERIAIVRNVGGRTQLEYPVGKVVYETGGWISHPRFSPKGHKIALINHPTPDDDSGEIVCVDLAGEKQVLSEKWISVQGLVWNRSKGEIWFTGTREGNLRAIYAVRPEGGERLIYKGTGSITLHDLADDGTALITYNQTHIKIAAKSSADAKERDLTWHDWSLVRDLSPDGARILFTEAGESGGTLYAAYTRNTDGANTKKLGEGSALAFSPNGKYALVKLGTSPPQMALYDTATADRKLLNAAETKTFFYQPWASWFPDGQRFLFTANEANIGTKLFMQAVDGDLICLTPDDEGFEITTPHAVSPDGTSALVVHPDKRIHLFSFADRKFEPIPELEPNYLAVGWSADGTRIFIRKRGQVPAVIFSYDLKTGEREQIFELLPQYRTGVFEILRVLLTPDQKAYAYSYTREFSDLMIIEGLK